MLFSCFWTESCRFFQATEIGKAVNGLRKHGSKQIRHLARTLIEYGFVSCGYVFTIAVIS